MTLKTETYKEFIKRKNAEFKHGKLIPMKDIGREARHFWQREAWTFMRQHNLTDKVFVIERIRRVKTEGAWRDSCLARSMTSPNRIL